MLNPGRDSEDAKTDAGPLLAPPRVMLGKRRGTARAAPGGASGYTSRNSGAREETRRMEEIPLDVKIDADLEGRVRLGILTLHGVAIHDADGGLAAEVDAC